MTVAMHCKSTAMDWFEGLKAWLQTSDSSWFRSTQANFFWSFFIFVWKLVKWAPIDLLIAVLSRVWLCHFFQRSKVKSIKNEIVIKLSSSALWKTLLLVIARRLSEGNFGLAVSLAWPGAAFPEIEKPANSWGLQKASSSLEIIMLRLCSVFAYFPYEMASFSFSDDIKMVGCIASSLTYENKEQRLSGIPVLTTFPLTKIP